MKSRPVVITALLVGVLGIGGLALGLARSRGGEKETQTPAVPPAGADSSLPPVQVGLISKYAPVNYTTGGVIDYSHVGDSWLYAVLRKDW